MLVQSNIRYYHQYTLVVPKNKIAACLLALTFVQQQWILYNVNMVQYGKTSLSHMPENRCLALHLF